MKSSVSDKNGLISGFLRQLPIRHHGIDAIFLFGSFVKSEIYRDVDTIIVFKDPAGVSAARGIARDFKEQFLIDLHIQLFLAHEQNSLHDFLSKAGNWECIYGQGLASKYPYVLPESHE